jgi:hypothetical protein
MSLTSDLRFDDDESVYVHKDAHYLLDSVCGPKEYQFLIPAYFLGAGSNPSQWSLRGIQF